MVIYHPKSESTFPAGSIAYIVGPNLFQNSLLANYIKLHGKSNCSVFHCLEEMEVCHHEASDKKTVVLYDCFNKFIGDCAKMMAREFEGMPDEFHLALFNLRRSSGIEHAALEFGARGIFYQNDTVDTLLRGLQVIFEGEFWVPRRDLADAMLTNSFGLRRRHFEGPELPNDLTHREIEILTMLTKGASNDIISERLFISTNTVRTHLNHIFKKINASSRLEASLWAIDHLYSR